MVQVLLWHTGQRLGFLPGEESTRQAQPVRHRAHKLDVNADFSTKGRSIENEAVGVSDVEP
jgi:hypothetical protein